MANKNPQYWESPQEIELIKRRRELRQRLQNEFNRVYYNPHRIAQHIEFLDPAVSRYSAMRAAIYEHWKPSWKGFWRWSFMSYIPIILLSLRLGKAMREMDEECGSGRIPYEHRDFRKI